MTKEDFPKYERICKKNDIALLFDKGEGVSVYPFRVIYMFRHDEAHPVTVRMLVSVSKKRFHHAFKRNRVKRLVRESWRHNKRLLYKMCLNHNISLDVALVYTATVIHSYDEMLVKTEKAVKEIVKRYEKHSKTPC